jgi:hypothetical protein
LEFCQYFLGILGAGQAIHNFKFGELDIYRVVVLAKEHFDIVFQYCGSSLYDEQDVPEGNILNLRAGREKGNCAENIND